MADAVREESWSDWRPPEGWQRSWPASRPLESGPERLRSTRSQAAWLPEGSLWQTSDAQYRITVQWRASCARAVWARPLVDGWPPIFEQRLAGLGNVWLISASGQSDPARAAVRTNTAAGVMRIVADAEDLIRWDDAGRRYLTAVQEHTAAIHEHWQAHHWQLNRPWAPARSREQWREVLARKYDQVLDASDRYRPVFEEIKTAIEQTSRVFTGLLAHLRVIHEWDRRTPWRLVDAGDEEIQIMRDALAGQRAPTGRTPRSFTGQNVGTLDEVCRFARDLRRTEPLQVTWHPASVGLCDRELADLRVAVPFGRSREQPPGLREFGWSGSGKPLLAMVPATFARVAQLHFGELLESLTDREARAPRR